MLGVALDEGKLVESELVRTGILAPALLRQYLGVGGGVRIKILRKRQMRFEAPHFGGAAAPLIQPIMQILERLTAGSYSQVDNVRNRKHRDRADADPECPSVAEDGFDRSGRSLAIRSDLPRGENGDVGPKPATGSNFPPDSIYELAHGIGNISHQSKKVNRSAVAQAAHNTPPTTAVL